ncbi:hypothetical protein Cgig2_019773 [Carnegiea gigantea]|uniref:Uncharacterized protein n=1 Tax=Carnegiea gigantea TaxID=171969 RepID=A0A9Q1JKK9_9CARY|nr:hypothetical protein Cgig2_019773 [Carnegiea gigantea]
MPWNSLKCQSSYWLKKIGERALRQLHHIFRELLFQRIKELLLQKIVLKYMKDFVLDKLISSVRHYKETKATKGLHFDGLFFFLMMLYLDIVVFIKRIVKREFPMMFTWTNEDIKKMVEDEDHNHGFGRGNSEPCLNVPHPSMTEQCPVEDIRSSEIEIEAIADLHSAHMEFTKLQPKQQPNEDDGGPSFSPTLALREPDSKGQTPATTSVAEASITVEKEAKKEMKKDDNMPSVSLGLRLSQPDSQIPVSQTTSVPDLNTAGENHDANEDDDDGAPLIFP